MTPRPFMRALALIATMILATNSVHAAEIHALITTAMKAAIDDLVPKFERETGNTVAVRLADPDCIYLRSRKVLEILARDTDPTVSGLARSELARHSW